MLTLPNLLRDSALSAALLVLVVSMSGWSLGVEGGTLPVVVGLAAGATISLLNLTTLGWVVAALEPGRPSGAFQVRLRLQQLGALVLGGTVLLVGVPPLPFVIGFLCFFPPVVWRAFAGLRVRPGAQESV